MLTAETRTVPSGSVQVTAECCPVIVVPVSSARHDALRVDERGPGDVHLIPVLQPNTFVVVQPDEDDPVWFASVAVLNDGGAEIVRRDTARNEQEVHTATSKPPGGGGL